MRHDVAGMFWDDTPPPKVSKSKEKRTPPEPVWLSPDYLPGLAEAKALDVCRFSDSSLYEAWERGDQLIFDVESFPNFFLVSFTSYQTGEAVWFELHEGEVLGCRDNQKLRWIFTSFTLVGFNSLHYDVGMVELMLAGWSCEQLKEATQRIIVFDERAGDILKSIRVKRLQINHIDLIEVCPLRANLKIYGGRLHSPRMQDLPFPPGTVLSEDQKSIVRWYNLYSDINATAYVFRELQEQIKLRVSLSQKYGVDLRSKSDAQIAETVIASELARIKGKRPERPEFVPGMRFYYEAPAFLSFSTPLLQHALATVCGVEFCTDEGGVVGLPDEIKNLELNINRSRYQMGLGGLHSNEKRACHFSSDGVTIYDRDVTGYYPQLIINSRMYPPQLGPWFLQVYQQIVEQRVVAKKAKNKVVADSLKITANGTFGKLGSPYSILYSPRQLIQVTLTGQLSLLMLIERLELAGIPVVSANTDGVVMLVQDEQHAAYLAIIEQWERDTGLATEETVYRALYSRDVNNYIAVKPDGKVKGKGAFLDAWGDPELAIFRFHKNPVNLVSTEAVVRYVTDGVLPVDTVNACTDITKFVNVRTVKGGAVKDGVFLGKSIRWYYGEGERGEIVYASSGNMVARSEGARPLMDMPAELPADLDRHWYVREAHEMIRDLGLEPPPLPVPAPPKLIPKDHHATC